MKIKSIIRKILSPTEYKTFILIGKGFDKDYIAEKLNVTRNSINEYFWTIRRNLENAELITKRKNGEKKNYNYLISFAKEVIKEQTNEK